MNAVLAREHQLDSLCYSDEVVGRVLESIESQPDGLLIDPETGEVLYDERWEEMPW